MTLRKSKCDEKENNSIFVEEKCYACGLVLYKNDAVSLDKRCKIQIHKSCKEKYKGVCPLCGKYIDRKNGRIMYECFLGMVITIFSIGSICFFLLLLQRL